MILILCILLAPLMAFLINGLAGHRWGGRVQGWIAVAAMGVSSISALGIAILFFLQPGYETRQLHYTFFTWLPLDDSLRITMGARLDSLSLIFVLVVTIVSLLVYFYSIDYMKDEKGYARFFAFLSLFTFSMLGLVVATNLIQLYMFWELVGLSSYLLIGFYYEKPSAVRAAKKAFVVTRFADFGFLVGILWLNQLTGTLEINVLNQPERFSHLLPEGGIFLGLPAMTWAMVLIFVGGAGKSAMFPLHIWLPDAMEGPTPVSALIHAATMVVAGVFLVARLFPLYVDAAPEALTLIAWTGSFSLLFAGLIACTQMDIKRILAYSTMSQIGYMMLALGTGGYGASLFHFFTHAFFKALLFLAAGVIIHAVHTQMINGMGNLRKALPIQHFLFLTGCLAISGIPPFAGFFSKDEILLSALSSAPGYFAAALLGGVITSFYMFRLYFRVFWYHGRPTAKEPFRSRLVTVPMVVMALASVAGGFFPVMRFTDTFSEPSPAADHTVVVWSSVGAALAGMVIAAFLYANPTSEQNRVRGFIYRVIANKFYIDEIYLFITRTLIFKGLAYPIAWFDRKVVDGLMNALAFITRWFAEKIKFVQSGQVQHYAFVFVTGSLVLAFIILYLIK